MNNDGLWSGKFGDEYTERNKSAYELRRGWWTKFCDDYRFRSVLEVGCNVGANLGMIASRTNAHKSIWGCDVNEGSLVQARKNEPHINFVWASGLDLPFKDDCFDLVFTAGVLIHLAPETRENMMQEVLRTSGKYVVSMEYDWPYFEEIPYRGQTAALYKGPWGEIYEKRYGLKLLSKCKLSKQDGFDDVTVNGDTFIAKLAQHERAAYT